MGMPEGESTPQSERERLFYELADWLKDAEIGSVKLIAFSDLAAEYFAIGDSESTSIPETEERKLKAWIHLEIIKETVRTNIDTMPGYLAQRSELLSNYVHPITQLRTGELQQRQLTSDPSSTLEKMASITAYAKRETGSRMEAIKLLHLHSIQ